MIVKSLSPEILCININMYNMTSSKNKSEMKLKPSGPPEGDVPNNKFNLDCYN